MAKKVGIKQSKRKRRVNPNSLRNLSPEWPKGTSGNLKGRPKSQDCVTSCLRKFATKKIKTKVDPTKLTYAEAAAFAHWKQAIEGDLKVFEFITERLEGKPKEFVEQMVHGDVKSEVKLIGGEDLKTALQSLVESGAIKITTD